MIREITTHPIASAIAAIAWAAMGFLGWAICAVGAQGEHE